MRALFVFLFVGSVVGILTGHLNPSYGSAGMLLSGILAVRFLRRNETIFDRTTPQQRSERKKINRFRRRVGWSVVILSLIAAHFLTKRWEHREEVRTSPETVQRLRELDKEVKTRKLNAHEASKHFEAAQPHLDKASQPEVTPEDKDGELQAALTEISQAVELQPENAQYLGLQATILGELGRYEEGRKSFELYLESGGKNYDFVDSLITRKQYEPALAIVDEQMKKRKPCELTLLRVKLLLELDRAGEAEQQFQKCGSCRTEEGYRELEKRVKAAVKKEEEEFLARQRAKRQGR